MLEELFERVVVPADVWTELEDKPGAPEPAALLWLRNIVVLPTPLPPPEAAHLDAGERAAIAFAVSKPGAWILLDEKQARAVAKQLGLVVRGTLGVLVEAKRRGLVGQLEPLIEQMVHNGCWFDRTLIDGVLASVGEM